MVMKRGGGGRQSVLARIMTLTPAAAAETTKSRHDKHTQRYSESHGAGCTWAHVPIAMHTFAMNTPSQKQYNTHTEHTTHTFKAV